ESVTDIAIFLHRGQSELRERILDWVREIAALTSALDRCKETMRKASDCQGQSELREQILDGCRGLLGHSQVLIEGRDLFLEELHDLYATVFVLDEILRQLPKQPPE